MNKVELDIRIYNDLIKAQHNYESELRKLQMRKTFKEGDE